VAQQGELLFLNSSQKVWLLSFPSHIIIPHMVVPFDSQQLMQTPLIESINLVYICLGNCPALGTVQEMQYSFNLVDMEIRDFHIWLSRFCIAARVMSL